MSKKIGGKTFYTPEEAREELGLEPPSAEEIAKARKILDEFQKRVDTVPPEARVRVSPKFYDDLAGTGIENWREWEGRAVPVREAAAFGRIVVPPGVEVLGASVFDQIETRYEIALRMRENDVQPLLTASGFSKKFAHFTVDPDRPVIAGPPLSTATSLWYEQDQIANEQNASVVRDFFVDIRSPDEVYVHIFLVPL